jgi:hypothetical protein
VADWRPYSPVLNFSGHLYLQHFAGERPDYASAYLATLRPFIAGRGPTNGGINLQYLSLVPPLSPRKIKFKLNTVDG